MAASTKEDTCAAAAICASLSAAKAEVPSVDNGTGSDANEETTEVLLGTNAVRLEWCRAKTDVDKRAESRTRRVHRIV